MPNKNRIQELTEAFVAELEIAVRESALEVVKDVLEGGTPAARRKPGRKPGRRKAPSRKKAARTGGRIRRSTADVQSMAEGILARVRSAPGISATELAKGLGVTTKDLRLPLIKLLEGRKLRTEGKARGTKYFAGSGPRKRVAKKARKKVTRKKAGRKKAGRKKSVRRKKA